jgi:D-serine deaminase-like pyridoxal phosphate-dependent protein
VFLSLQEKVPACTIFSGTGTGTYDIDIQIAELTELQVGSYAVMDAEYINIGAQDDPSRFSAFKPAPTLLTTVVSVNQPEFVTVDAGLKSLYRHGGLPFVVSPEFTDLRYDWFGDEYGKLSCAENGNLPRREKVIDRWPIDLRGKSQ